MTTVYFVRHAESDISVRDEIRPLTKKGYEDCGLVTAFFSDKKIDIILSSPYRRAIDTVADTARVAGLPVITVEDFRERKSNSLWANSADLQCFRKNLWDDFSFTDSDGECLSELQERNITALNKVLTLYENKNIVIGTHGTALSAIINYYDRSFGFTDFMEMKNIALCKQT